MSAEIGVYSQPLARVTIIWINTLLFVSGNKLMNEPFTLCLFKFVFVTFHLFRDCFEITSNIEYLNQLF